MYQISSSDFCNKDRCKNKSNTGCRGFFESDSYTHLADSGSSASFKSVNTLDDDSSCDEETVANYGCGSSEAKCGKETQKGKYTCTCEPCCQCDNCPFDEDNSQHSSFDEECLEQLNSLVDEEQKLTSQIEELENQRKKSCSHNAAMCEGGSKNLQKILQQMNCYLHKENKKLGCDLAKAKRDLEGCVRGPARQGPVPPGMEHCKYTKQIKELQEQLQATCENMKNLDQTNVRLQQELAYLKEKCKMCQDDDSCGEEDDLSDLACQIAEILKDMENCETCKTVPTALKCTVTQIKNIAELVYSRISKQCEDEGSCICSDDGSDASSDDCVC